MRKRFFIVSALLLVIASGLLLGIRHYSHPVIDYAAGHPGIEVVVTIPPGATGADVARILLKNKVVMTWQAFFNRATADSRSVGIQPGAHRIATHLSAKVALDQLLDRTRMVGLINITEGMRAADVLALLGKNGWNESELKAAFAGAKPPMGYDAPNLEGYLFPASYSFAPGTSSAKVLQTMLDRFQSEATSINLVAGAKTRSLSPAQIVTIASLAQAEGGPSDFAKIARVVLNRLAVGMKLQLDTTVLYALKATGRIRVTNTDLLVPSSYNTYKNAGLPPGPIGNPGRLALLAAMNPAPGPWLYFITVRPGETRFTASESEFFRWKIEYEQNYAAGAFNVSGSKP
ncbi:putative aminodeoxychorismate lyase [mine drainage metagenome]|uniref:Putative aminodeoxychorismate lyase n=1 Tax=mine drainage metagenome TaxID=410659 RepID=A0A1J5Q052_9ZZZZ